MTSRIARTPCSCRQDNNKEAGEGEGELKRVEEVGGGGGGLGGEGASRPTS